jgi:hypothetical protein
MCFECVILCEVACDHQTVSGLPITLCVYMTYDHEPLGQAFVKVGYAVFCDCETMWVLITFGADCVLSCVMPAVGLSVHDISYPCSLASWCRWESLMHPTTSPSFLQVAQVDPRRYFSVQLPTLAQHPMVLVPDLCRETLVSAGSPHPRKKNYLAHSSNQSSFIPQQPFQNFTQTPEKTNPPLTFLQS